MLKLTLTEFFLRSIPESFLLVLLVYLISNKNFKNKDYFISAVILSASMYLVRALPIQFGIHTIIIIMIFIVINHLISKIPVKKSIASSMISMITLAICESVNFLLLSFAKVNMEMLSVNIALRMIYFMPSLILLAVISYILYLVKNRTKRGFNHVSN